MVVRAYIALGSNLDSPAGDRQSHLDYALEQLAALPGTTLDERSSVLHTDPVGPPGQGPYLNAVIAVRTALGPRELLDAMLAIERARGRDRTSEGRWGPRTLDLDLLIHGDRIIREPGLIVPHPRLHERAFVLEPLAQIAPDLIVPGLGVTVLALKRRLHDAFKDSPNDGPNDRPNDK
ncbi:MAG: 2-amino-4-hydroxy-6-hydroxymethyldihydropteridine diphosphokinase [Phycisphaerae bacterium]|nr:2-amino-4-hydroxy-6-hydroxymethyldihydropteridine diphosphokinase [Phycisphaerae bacterium]